MGTATKKKQNSSNGATKHGGKAQLLELEPLSDALSVEQRIEIGKTARLATPREALSELRLAADRPDPVDVLVKQAEHRLPELLPIRYGRMLSSPFAFYRGAAAIMATDLKESSRSGLESQLCGDAHLANFGFFASPERTLVFDINDFDETLPGPWEFDLKRLAASFVIASRHAGHRERDARYAAETAVRSYQREMARLSTLPVLQLWYSRVDESDFMKWAASRGAAQAKRSASSVKTVKGRTSLQATAKLTTVVDGHLRFAESSTVHRLSAEVEQRLHESFSSFRDALSDERKWLFDQFTFVDCALKVVGVGSVGTRALVVLLRGRDNTDHLILQIKQSEHSVLELAGGTSIYKNQGQRVVNGQRLVQSSSDIFLSWARAPLGDDFYLRQLRDWKYAIEVEQLDPEMLAEYAVFTGHILAKAHARSGDPIAIAAYIGKSDALVDAIGDFAVAYADQNARDYEALIGAVNAGRIEARMDI